ncbi:N-acetyltransferase [Hymenobacter sp. 5516J-16]|uniref:GNAT family N-acetyltransferase n=1 Tax=Hymenobacter sp. 5516J-16 TaxID=2932253 RepID=UPI001FD1A8AA|nr:GNAT family N-acetyltransferase [Hymenobacter sp. 5516J-16]UOQ76491.1 N-acetyltransferase [Hymenobacter sp. 5516J-16]
MAASITHNAPDQEFTIIQDGYTAELAYSQPQQGVIDFTHTFVEEGLRGKGVAEELARAGLAYAREQQLRVRTSCEFMQHFVQRHPEYQELLEPAD